MKIANPGHDFAAPTWMTDHLRYTGQYDILVQQHTRGWSKSISDCPRLRVNTGSSRQTSLSKQSPTTTPRQPGGSL